MSYGIHGYCNSVTNSILTLPSFVREFPELDEITTVGEERRKNATTQGVTVGLYQVGCSIGALCCFYLTGKFGRKRVIQILGALIFLGFVLHISATTLPHLMIGRIVTGLGVGAGQSTFPLYLSETVSPNVRGRAIISCALAANLGHLLGAALGTAFWFIRWDSIAWRMPLAIGLVFGIPSAVMPYWIPETPYWLLWNGHFGKAVRVQSKLSGLTEDDPVLLSELERLWKDKETNCFESSKTPKWIWRSFLAITCQIMTSLCGIDILTFFSTQMLQSQLHFSALKSRCLTLGLQACQVVFSVLAIGLIDILGRRPLLIGSAAVIAVSMGCLSGLTAPDATTTMLNVSVIFLFLCMAAYPVGLHLIPAMVCAEISPGRMRHEITALGGAFHWATNFVITLVTPVAFASISYRYYFVYMSTNIFSVVFVYLFYPDTKGLSLEGIDDIFRNSTGYFDVIRASERLERSSRSKSQNLDEISYLSFTSETYETRGTPKN